MNKKILFIMVAILLVLTLVGCEKLYSITVEVNGNGTAAADVASASEGRTVTLTVTPDEGYELKSISVNGEEIEGTRLCDAGERRNGSGRICEADKGIHGSIQELGRNSIKDRASRGGEIRDGAGHTGKGSGRIQYI